MVFVTNVRVIESVIGSAPVKHPHLVERSFILTPYSSTQELSMNVAASHIGYINGDISVLYVTAFPINQK